MPVLVSSGCLGVEPALQAEDHKEVQEALDELVPHVAGGNVAAGTDDLVPVFPEVVGQLGECFPPEAVKLLGIGRKCQRLENPYLSPRSAKSSTCCS